MRFPEYKTYSGACFGLAQALRALGRVQVVKTKGRIEDRPLGLAARGVPYLANVNGCPHLHVILKGDNGFVTSEVKSWRKLPPFVDHSGYQYVVVEVTTRNSTYELRHLLEIQGGDV